MATITAEGFARALQRAQDELSVVVGTLKEKGLNRFGRTLAIGFLGVFFSYYLLYLPPGKKLGGLNKKIETAKATAQYADQYKDLRDRLDILYGQLPPLTGRERWLTNAVLDSMKAENIMSDSIVPPDETEQSGLIIQRLTVSIQLKFTELVSWLNRIEASKPLLHVGSLELIKKDAPVGANGINCEIGTVIPSQRPGQP